MKKLIVVLILIYSSLNCSSQLGYNLALSTGVNSIAINDFAFINIPIKAEFELVFRPRFSMSFFLSQEYSINKNLNEEKAKVLEIGFLNFNIAVLNDLDIGNSISVNFGSGITANDNFMSVYAKLGLTGQTEFVEGKFLFLNVGYLKSLAGDYNGRDYIKNRFQLNTGIKFMLN
tara:strand:- start:1457 stop:1978 length:522 start_codon:yes stop_codon:yes gene_type:complete